MLKMYCVFAELLGYPVEMESFRNLEAAKAWVKGNE